MLHLFSSLYKSNMLFLGIVCKTKVVLDVGLLDVDGQHPGGGGGDGEAGDLPHKHLCRVPGHLHFHSCCILYQLPFYDFTSSMMLLLHLEKPPCQPGSDGLLEADHQHLLLPGDHCDFAKALKEL